MVLRYFPNTSSSISSSQIINGLSGINFVTNSASSWIGKTYYTPSSTPLTVGSSPNWNQFRGNMYDDGVSPPGPGCPPSGGPSCFLAGTPVMLSDGSFKAIEKIIPGDMVTGAFGEVNEILALDWVVLGDRWIYHINKEHWTSDDHPHISPDKQFYACEPDAIYQEWGNYFDVITANGIEKWINIGLTKHKVTALEVGKNLQTLSGPKEVKSIEQIRMSPNTPLYNLVVGGSHTYTVDGYAVTGWPREDDFDYDTWTKKD